MRHASPEPPAVRGPLRRFLRRRQSINSQNHPLARPPIMIDNDHYASNNTADRPDRDGPTPRRVGAAGRRHADHPEARRRLYQRQHPTGLPRRAVAPGRLAGARPAHRRPAGRLPRRDLRGGPRARHRRPRRGRCQVSGQARRPGGPRRGTHRARVGRVPPHGRRPGPGPGQATERGRARRDSRHRRTAPHRRPGRRIHHHGAPPGPTRRRDRLAVVYGRAAAVGSERA